MTAERDRAWDGHALHQERTGATGACLLVIAIMPAWTVFDRWLEPAHAMAFLAIRIGVALVGVGSLVLIRRAKSIAVVRRAMWATATATGVGVATIIPCLDHSAVIYTVGFSVVFWGFAPLIAWPSHYTVTCYGTILAVHLALRRLGPETGVDAATFYGLFAYLTSAALIATCVSVVRRRLEYRAFVASYELETRNRELAAALATLRDAQERFVATEKLSALGRLIAQLSHEINNPVNVLQNNLGPVVEYLASVDEILALAAKLHGEPSSELMRRWAELEIDFVRGDLKDAVSTMAAAAERIRSIHHDLRCFMRGDAAVPSEADFNAGVRSTVAMLRRNLAPGAVLVENYGELPPTRFHPGQLNQVTMNLVQNALDAIGNAGRIEIETRVDGGDLVLAVTDSGAGMSEAAKRHLFEPFYTTKDVGKGTGLGLATCYQIMCAHGGSVSLDESCPTGTRFVVRLPALH